MDSVPNGPEQTDAGVDATRVARRLLGADCRVVGLLPLASAGPIHDSVCALGRALVDATGQTVAVIDVGCSWPLWDDGAPSSNRAFVTGRWLHAGRLAAIRPAHPPVPGEGLAVLAALLGNARSRCPYALVDMSGLRAAGEHFGAFTLVDGVCLIARSGKTRERELVSIYDELDPRKNLGVLLLSD
jgi:hypothetical protein